MNAIFAGSRTKGTVRLVLLAIADCADHEGEAYPSLDFIARRANATKQTSRRAIRSATQIGELAIVKNGGPKGCNRYRIRLENLVQGVSPTTGGVSPTTPITDDLPPITDDSPGVSSTIGGGITDDRQGVSPVIPKPSKEPSGEPSKEPSNGLPSSARRISSIDGRAVSEGELDLATGVLVAFNEVAGTRFASKEFVRVIVMRLREHPELDLADHRAVIERQFRDPWWTSAPDPRVVYGNPEVFERSLNAGSFARPGEHTEAEFDEWLQKKDGEQARRARENADETEAMLRQAIEAEGGDYDEWRGGTT